ncbi:MAG: hypothetical protein COA84_11755 [Robiginitomaculum sp.]|nr:MAG: hypothetical protein COA84_11755 [Robiginitomaculum sp.]
MNTVCKVNIVHFSAYMSFIFEGGGLGKSAFQLSEKKMQVRRQTLHCMRQYAEMTGSVPLTTRADWAFMNE